MKTFPKNFTLDVFGLKYKVKVTKLDEGLAGLCIPKIKTILISDQQTKEDALHTLIHELSHSVFSRSGIRQAHISGDIEEVIVENIATAICENFNLTLKKR